MGSIKEALTFDDVLMLPRYSTVIPSKTNINLKLTDKILLKVPFLSSAMDTVTESNMAIAIGREMGLSLRGWVVEELDTSFYVVTKHNNETDQALADLLCEMKKRDLISDLYVHLNGNNLALMPLGLNKRFAVQEIIKRDKAVNGERPIIGFGDSISDLGFMSECHFWGTPGNSQITRTIMESIHG